MKSLYLCYFGLQEPLVQTQVLPYLRHLSRSSVQVYLLTFEGKQQPAWSEKSANEWRSKLQAEGIRWYTRPYHKRPSMAATFYDIVAGACLACSLVRRHNIDVLHARAHIPMAMAMLAQLFTKCQTIFDIRGLMAEEYADAGIWAEGSLPFRAVKFVEREGLRRADQVVVLTRRMRDWIVQHQLKSPEQIEVIPCCVDLSRFNRDMQAGSTSSERFEVVYAGSVTGLYLLNEMVRFFKFLQKKRPDAFLRILTTSSPSQATERLQRGGLRPDDFWIGSVKPEEVPRYLRQARLGLSFRKSAFSQIAASPTKVAEYLAAGLPVVSNCGIGDVDELLGTNRVGISVKALDDNCLLEAADLILSLLQERDLNSRCKLVARHEFDLNEVGGARYLRVYERLGGG